MSGLWDLFTAVVWGLCVTVLDTWWLWGPIVLVSLGMHWGRQDSEAYHRLKREGKSTDLPFDSERGT